ncbi:MAG: glycosyltransferase family 4 protein [Chitinivibrionia bacterium]|nr:glycosyltransferase family 4 protein [Chitinivibrionia bacterium]
MNILIFNWRDIKHPRAGGAEVHLHGIFEPIAKAGNKIFVVSSGFAGGAAKENINGIQIIRVGNEMSYPFEVWKNFKKYEEEFSPDIIYEDFNKLPLFTPIITKRPKLIQMHHLWLTSIFREASFIAACIVWLGEQTLRFFYRNEQFVVVSDSSKKELKRYGIKDEKIEIIHNGIDDNFYVPSPERDVEKCEKYLLFVGRLQKYKGILDVCETFEKVLKKFPDLKLKIAGNGTFRAKLQKWIKKRNFNEKISLLGFISQDEKLRLLQRAFLLVQPSYKEGWGLTVIEANACGVPVVANNAPGLCDSVVDGKTGLLYKFGDTCDAAKKIIELIENPQKYGELSSNCLTWSQKFKWQKASDETFNLLKKIIAKN